MSTSSEPTFVRVSAAELESFAAAAFVAHGVSEIESRRAARVLTYADRIGRSSHGIANLDRIYLHKLREGQIDADAVPSPVLVLPAATVLDARHSLGLSTAVAAMDRAIDHARNAGVGLVLVRNGTHFGCAAYFTEHAARRGMVGIAAANCGGQRIAPPPGGTSPMLGTNPISIATAAGTLPPFVLDMSTTVVATSRIREAARKGDRVPIGWLNGPQGEPVTDPNEFLAGRATVAFLGGSEETGAYKGYGLAVAVDVLCGLLSGSSVGPGPLDAHDATDRNIGQAFLAFDVGQLRGAEDYAEAASSMFQGLLDCPAVAGRSVSYPGVPELARREATDTQGVPLHATVFADLVDLASRLRIRAPRSLGGEAT